MLINKIDVLLIGAEDRAYRNEEKNKACNRWKKRIGSLDSEKWIGTVIDGKRELN